MKGTEADRRGWRRWRAWRLVLLACLAAGCAVNPVTGQSELMLVSEEAELAMGREAYAPLVWQDGGPLQIEPAIQAYLAEIVARLHRVSHRPDLPVDFTLHSASTPNAWAIPGHTAMHRGLLDTLENEAQFAFVMGHEIGHVAARHSAQRQTYGLVGGGLLGLAGVAVSSQDTGALGALGLGAAAIGTKLMLLRYDRAQELEADRLGVLYMARAGYDPGEAVAAHRALNRAIDTYLAAVGRRREDPGPLGDLLATHPRHEVRIDELQRVVQTIPPGEARLDGDGRFADRWRTRTAGIRALAPAYAHYERARLALGRRDGGTAGREVGEALRLADQAQFASLQAVVSAQQGRLAEAEGAFRRALDRYPGYQPALHGLGVVEFARQQYAAAVPLLEESLRLRPGFGPSQYVLGLSLARLGRGAEAIPYLDAVARANPRHPEVHGLLARLHEAAGDRRAAVDAWRVQRAVAPDSALGREAAQRLAAVAPLGVPYVSPRLGVRFERPGAWTVGGERAGERGGELVLRRADPPLEVRVAVRNEETVPDLGARVDAQIRARLGPGARVVHEDRQARLGGHPAVAKTAVVGGTEALVAAAATGRRAVWVEIVAGPGTWRDPEITAEIRRFLDSLGF